jgi:hypothetical protein
LEHLRKAGTQEFPSFETRLAPALLGATHRAFTFYLGNPISSIPVFLIPSMCELGSGRRGDLLTPKAFASRELLPIAISLFLDKQICGNLRS